ncbi:type I polyketide synthase [Pseudonocardia sp. TRM90224]|uniref:type I polyketide synthase n=1 Tax=Pseudonocardia sp. TRM90224 TaxID=2812678 RepID=UPI001E522E94|nr:type I polyketide synthase [Pseudonocardia sp. TRM90224]
MSSSNAEMAPIAVVGLAGRFPGAADVAEFWDALRAGRDLITDFDIAAQRALGVPEDVLADPRFVAAAPVLAGIEEFDAALFGFTPREAELRDPQHRLFLEIAHTALEHAGIDPARPGGRIGVFAGVKDNDYLAKVLRSDPGLEERVDGMTLGVANDHDFVSTITSYTLDLRGPSFTVNSACSTSLVAVHLAARALAAGDCEIALAGAASLEIPQGRGYLHREGGVLSPDGHCRPFSADAAGTVWGGGAAAVVLKPLAAALADGDTVHAVLIGSALSNDGAGKAGFTAPGEDGQVAAIGAALAAAGVDPRSVSYVEAHGTGTRIGDPVEVAALTRAYSAGDDRQWCLLGSVKSNVGHLVAAAGMAGLVKTIMALRHELIPATLHVQRPHELIDFAASPFRLATAATPWPREAGAPRRAGVSAFGIGGTNAHVLVEEAPRTALPVMPSAPRQLLPVSAATGAARDQSLARLGAHLLARPELDLAEVASTLQLGRAQHAHRAVLVAGDTADAAHALVANERGRVRVARVPDTPPRVALLLTGQGAQHPGMAAGLYDHWNAYRAAFDECAELLAEPLGRDLRDVLRTASDDDLRRTWLTQPALFAVEYAMAQLWRSWGVEPAAAIGHSVGELVAATLAGVFTLPDALTLVATRGRLMQEMPPGAMLAVALDETVVAPDLPAELAVATVNAPGSCVVAGPAEAVDEYAAGLAVPSTRLRTSHAFHSVMMEPAAQSFVAAVGDVPRAAPRMPFLSNVTGDWITDEQATDPHYWGRHVREPVRFGACVATLLGSGPDGWALVEAGPGRTLTDLARRALGRGAPAPLSTLAPGTAADPARDVESALSALGELWMRGVSIDWSTVAAPTRRRIPLPTYPYQRKRHWFEPPARSAGTAGTAGTAPAAPRTGPLAPDERFTVPGWTQAAPVIGAPRPTGPLLVIAEPGSAGDELATRLAGDGASVVRVRSGAGFEWPSAAEVVVNPAERDDWIWLFDALAESGAAPRRIVDASGLGGGKLGTDGASTSLLRLVALGQALVARAEQAELVVLTAGAQDVHGDDLTRPELAVVAGPCRTLPLESAVITCRHVDALGAGPEVIAAELAAPDAEPVVALRGRRRWVPTTQQVRLGGGDPAGDPAAGLRPGGVWLVTGGLGGVGSAIAEHLANRSAARVVLVGRTVDPDAAADAQQRISAAGGEALVAAADVTDRTALRTLRATVEERFGRIDGIVHAAGVPGSGLLELTSAADVARVVAPKITGTLALGEVFGDLPLDAFVLCSSVSAITGGVGQVDYVAANAFLDAYAASPSRPIERTVSIGWGAWLDTGMYAAWRDGTRPHRHPWLRTRRDEPDGAVVLAGELRSDMWVLDEHRLDGVAVLPGTAMVELLLAGRAAVAGAGPAALRNVRFMAPLAVADDGSVRVEVRVEPGAAGEWAITLSSTDGVAVRHAVAMSVEPRPAGSTHVVPGAGTGPARPPFDEPWLEFGPRWSSVCGVASMSGAQVAELQAPEVVAAELAAFTVHPALLDAALAAGAPGDQEGRFLPSGYNRIDVHGPLPARLRSVLRPSPVPPGATADETDERRIDAVLVDTDGHEVVRVEGFTLQRAQGRTSAPAPRSVDAPGIRPAEGAEALRRVLAAGIGPHVLVSAVPLEEMRAGLRPEPPPSNDSAQDVVAAPAERDGLEPYIAPRTELERQLVALWSEAIGVGEIGVDDDYFGLGGNSMAGVHLLWRVGETLGVTLTMRTLFDAPTVAGMAAAVELAQATGTAAPAASPITILPR